MATMALTIPCDCLVIFYFILRNEVTDIAPTGVIDQFNGITKPLRTDRGPSWQGSHLEDFESSLRKHRFATRTQESESHDILNTTI